jgi:hypothetical protein
MQDFITVLRELESEGLFVWFGCTPGLTEDSLVARSQMRFRIGNGSIQGRLEPHS